MPPREVVMVLFDSEPKPQEVPSWLKLGRVLLPVILIGIFLGTSMHLRKKAYLLNAQIKAEAERVAQVETALKAKEKQWLADTETKLDDMLANDVYVVTQGLERGRSRKAVQRFAEVVGAYNNLVREYQKRCAEHCRSFPIITL